MNGFHLANVGLL